MRLLWVNASSSVETRHSLLFDLNLKHFDPQMTVKQQVELVSQVSELPLGSTVNLANRCVWRYFDWILQSSLSL